MVKRKLKEITKLLLHVTSTTIFHIKFGKEKLALSAPFCLGCWCLGRTRLLKPHLGSILKHLSYLEMMKKRRLGDFCNLGLMIFPQSKAEKENRWSVSPPQPHPFLIPNPTLQLLQPIQGSWQPWGFTPANGFLVDAYTWCFMIPRRLMPSFTNKSLQRCSKLRLDSSRMTKCSQPARTVFLFIRVLGITIQ